MTAGANSHTSSTPSKPYDHHPSLPPPSSPALEACLSRILLIRLRHDIARLYSGHLVRVCEDVLPILMVDIVALSSPGWLAANARQSEELKAFLRSCIAMDLRQVGERVGTKSLIWSYTAVRDFAVARNIPLCPRSGIHSYSLVPHTNKLKAHLQTLEALPPPTFYKPHTMGRLLPNFDVIEKHCEARVRRMIFACRKDEGVYPSAYECTSDDEEEGEEKEEKEERRRLLPPAWRDWKVKIKIGYDMLVTALWETANEFNPAGFGAGLTDRLTTSWCDCGCSWDWLGEIAEKMFHKDIDSRPNRTGKEREWDGRGSGVPGWNTESESDVWEFDLDFKQSHGDENGREDAEESFYTTGELVRLRYVQAERAKEKGNTLFKRGCYKEAIDCYEEAQGHEPGIPYYQLNIAAAHLKLQNWINAEEACTRSLGQHLTGKGFWRRSKARQGLGKREEAIQDLREMLKLRADDADAAAELLKLKDESRNDRRLSPSSRENEAWQTRSCGSSSSSAPSPTTSTSRLNTSLTKTGPSISDDLPFDLHDVDFTRIKIGSIKRTWRALDNNQEETFSYPVWDSHDVSLA
ncbi:hypothetical protein FRB96_004532 [Tulasnella sp. 330]|nr:hypothetical protein FRB96_004532 [Tulasnella sp. 330]KAG8890818.1 hypothetical protein FRB98_004863 [Tulasnella sp. 332]